MEDDESPLRITQHTPTRVSFHRIHDGYEYVLEAWERESTSWQRSGWEVVRRPIVIPGGEGWSRFLHNLDCKIFPNRYAHVRELFAEFFMEQLL